ncbi:hypothetical protein N8802_00020 [Flavobacteriales bacterium]|nr:hypothetical protein [Flavobacteriales bacterium]
MIETHWMQKSIESRTFGMPSVIFCAQVSVRNALSRVAIGAFAMVIGLFVSVSAIAQEDLFLVFGSVKLEDANKRLEGVDVIVYQDGEVFDQLKTNAKGDYDFELPLRHLYTFSFVLDGHSNKRIEVDASGIPESVIGNRNMDLDMSMLPLPEGFDRSIFEDAYGRGEYDANKNTVVFDSNYTVRMRNKVNAEFSRLERLASESERMRENFEDFVAKGDRSKSSKEWQKAIDFYDSALALFPDEQEVVDKRLQAQNALDEANASNASAAAFQSLLDAGDEALSRDDLTGARQSFNDAKTMKPDAREPEDGLRRVDERESFLLANSEAEAEYQQLILDADKYFEREQYDRAIGLYSEALGLKPDERYPKNRIEEAETRQSDLASQAADIVERTIQYEALIDEANQLFRNDDYESALVKYEAAGQLLPAERFWQQRAEASRERLAEMESDAAERAAREQAVADRAAASAALKEKRREYDAINDDADVLFRNDDYEAAIAKYEQALEVLPEERYPQQRITEARKRINEAAGLDSASEARDDEALVADAKDSQGKERESRNEKDDRAEKNDAREAERSAEAAQREADRAASEAQRESDRAASEAQRAADRAASEAEREAGRAEAEADQMARLAAENEARAAAQSAEEEYNALILEADNAFDAYNWSESRRKYNSALNVKPNDRYAQSRLSRIERSESNATEASEKSEDAAANAAAMEEQRLLEEQAFESLIESERLAEEAERQRRMDEAAAIEEEREEQRRRQAELDRKRAEQVMSRLNATEEDEVEKYFSEALKSEALARNAQVEAQKESQAQLRSASAALSTERIERERQKTLDLERTMQRNEASSIQSQKERQADEATLQSKYLAESNATQRRANRLIQNGADAVANEQESQTRLRSNRARDYAKSVPELEAKKRTWRTLFKGLNRAAAETRSISSEQIAAASTRYREIGSGSSQRAKERWYDVRRQAKKASQSLSKRERESQQRAYDRRVEEKERLDNMKPRSPEDYTLPLEHADVLQGVSEESYDIPNGLVIERTVRNGNKVIRYRKVVTKTGTYYFKADRSITSVTWKRETSMVLD